MGCMYFGSLVTVLRKVHPVLTKEFYENQFGKKKNPSEAGKKGAATSNARQKEKRLLREALKMMLEMQDENALQGMDQTNAQAIAIAAIKKAKDGDIPACIFVRDTSGEKPVDKQEVEVGELQKLVVEVKE